MKPMNLCTDFPISILSRLRCVSIILLFSNIYIFCFGRHTFPWPWDDIDAPSLFPIMSLYELKLELQKAHQELIDKVIFLFFSCKSCQAFHVLYHTDTNVLLGAPTGSGKTISAELAILHLFNTQPDMKVVYIAPLKAIVRERMNDWRQRLVSQLGKKMVEMTGDFTPDMTALLSANIIISTPEKWDGISRNWHSRSYVMKVGLMILDEIHLLGADRGPILEVTN